MPITINNKNVSNRSWGDVDKTGLKNRLQAALEEGVAGAADAIRECYAVLRGEAIDDAPSQNWWGPHHELNRNNVLVLNRGGMIAAAGALAGARAEPDLTAEQLKRAARHVLKHYRQEEVNLQPPESLLNLAGQGEMLNAKIIGEMRPADIPLAPGVNLVALKADDEDPMEVVVEIPHGTSKNGLVYGKVVIRRIAEQVMQRPIAGFLGHQKEDEISSEFPIPVVHWVGAIYRDGSAFVRGVIDKAASDLKRWIRANVINQVSIYGYVTTEVRDEVTHVTNFELLSIDWVPLDRAGMATRVVAVGEINHYKGGLDMTLQEAYGELRKANVKPSQLLNEMGWDAKAVAKEMGWDASTIGGEAWDKAQGAQKTLGEIRAIFGLDEKGDVLLSVKSAQEVQMKTLAAEKTKMIDRVVEELVPSEMFRPLVKEMIHIYEGADEAAIKKAVSDVLAKESIKKAVEMMFKENPIMPKDADRDGTKNSVTVKKVRI